MTWRTHVLGGVASLWLLEALPGGAGGQYAGGAGALAMAAALGSLLPDLDAADSKAKRLSVGGVAPFALPALALHRMLGHRRLLHSALGLALFGLLVCLPLAVWWGAGLSLALGLGYASHLALDACTKAGIPLWHPNSRRCFLLPLALRVTTGSPDEEIALCLLALAALALLLRHIPAA